METRKNIFIMEDHDQAYYTWKKLGIKNATLLHIDAHIDVAWFNSASPCDLLNAGSQEALDALLRSVPAWNPSPDEKSHKPDIGNYICSAMLDGIVDKMYWVVPDDFFSTDKKIRYWAGRIKALVDRAPGDKPSIHVYGKVIKTGFSGKELVACSLADLPAISEPVLLDIDTDFFVTPHEANSQPSLLYLKKQMPWMWPDELAIALDEKGIKSIVSTIAYSVEGYYTPIRYKFLGDWLKLILEGAPEAGAPMAAMTCLKEAAILEAHGKVSEALVLARRATELEPHSAAAYFILSGLQYEEGLKDKAKRSYRRALQIDSTYGTRYNNSADIFFGLGMFERMDREIERILALGEEGAPVRISRGEGLFARRKYGAAGLEFEGALRIEKRSSRAKYALAKVRHAEKRFEDASAILEEIVIDDPGHFGARFLLGDIVLKMGRYKEALDHYKIFLRFGYCDPGLYARLSMLYLFEMNFRRSLKYLTRSIAIAPLALKEDIASRLRLAIFKRKVTSYVQA